MYTIYVHENNMYARHTPTTSNTTNRYTRPVDSCCLCSTPADAPTTARFGLITYQLFWLTSAWADPTPLAGLGTKGTNFSRDVYIASIAAA